MGYGFKTRNQIYGFHLFDCCFESVKELLSSCHIRAANLLLSWFLYQALSGCEHIASYQVAAHLLGFVSELLNIRKTPDNEAHASRVFNSSLPMFISRLEQIPLEDRQELGQLVLDIIKDYGFRDYQLHISGRLIRLDFASRFCGSG